MTAKLDLSQGLFADTVDDWRVFVVHADTINRGVFYVGAYPYDLHGKALHPQAPAIATTWDGKTSGARQISERQKRFDSVMAPVHFEPVIERHFA